MEKRRESELRGPTGTWREVRKTGSHSKLVKAQATAAGQEVIPNWLRTRLQLRVGEVERRDWRGSNRLCMWDFFVQL